MWGEDEVAVDIVEVDETILIVVITTPVGRLEMIGEFFQRGRMLVGDRVHIQGLHAGALGRRGLNAIGAKLLKEADVDKIVIQGGARTTGPGKGRVPRRIHFPGRRDPADRR